MSRFKIYILFLIIVAGGALLAFSASSGYYPIAIVGNRIVLARAFWKNYEAAEIYYGNLERTYGASSTIVSANGEFEKLVLEALVEGSLIHTEALRELGGDLSYLIEEKLGKFESDARLKEAAAAVYGLNAYDFKNEILVPQAEREILSGRLFLKGEGLEKKLIKELKRRVC